MMQDVVAESGCIHRQKIKHEDDFSFFNCHAGNESINSIKVVRSCRPEISGLCVASNG
jgi:hypothetical protein